MNKAAFLHVTVACLLALGLLVGGFVWVSHSSAETLARPQADLPDLTLSTLTITPTHIVTHQPVSITFSAVNQGAIDSYGLRVWLFTNPQIDPASQLPVTTTNQYTREVALGITMTIGSPVEVSYLNVVLTPTTSGCQNVLYAWVDPLSRIAESDEANNLRAVNVCVDAQGSAQDTYEPDDTCGAGVALLPSDGSAQARSFAPLNDVDYVRLQATQSVTYTITAAGTGADADPDLEISDSCNFTPAFGTTTRVEFVAPTTGTYYLKLSNHNSNPDPALSAYQLTAVAQQPITGTQPILLDFSPTSGLNSSNTNLVITGTQFVYPTLAEVCTFANNACTASCAQLLNTSWVSAQKLFGVVPANLNPGPYCLQVTNPGGRSARLSNAFTVLPAAPDPHLVLPGAAYGDAPTDLHLYGFNFDANISVIVGPVGLDNLKIINGTHLLGTLPSGLSAGAYTLTASYNGGGSGSLPNAIFILPPQEDLYAQNNELWHDPVTPRAGEPMSVGLVVHRRGGAAPLANVPVEFSINGTPISTTVIPLLSADGLATTNRVPYTPTLAGTYTVTALIDPSQTLIEATRANNLVTQTVEVLPPTGDGIAPHVDSLTINGTSPQVVTSTQVWLSASATDFPAAPTGTGVAEVRYIEFEFNQGARLWVPVRDSQWLNYTLNHLNIPWTLTPVGGLHYLQAWAKDGAGNISRYPYQSAVTYLPATERVGRDQTRVYRQTLAAGQCLKVTLTPTSGDPDLYIWPPNWQSGNPPWVSNLVGADSFVLTANDVTAAGEYQIEVYGYSAAQYQLAIEPGACVAAPRLARPGDAKPIPTAPFIPVNSVPPRDVDAGVNYRVYLPLVRR